MRNRSGIGQIPLRVSVEGRRGVSDRVLLVWFFVAVAFILLVSGGMLLNRAVWTQRVETKIAELAAAGYPVTMEELKRRHEEAMPEVNAAGIYQKAFAATRTKTGFNNDFLPLFGNAKLPEVGNPLPPEMAEEIGRFLEQNSEAVTYFLEGSQVPECRFSPIFLSEGDVDVEYVWPFRGGACLLALKVVLEAHETRSLEAAETASAIFRMSDHLRGEMFLVSAFYRYAIAGIGFAHLPWVLNSDDLSEEALVRLQEAIAASEDEFLLASALPSEFVEGIYYLRTGFSERFGQPDNLESYLGSGLRGAYRVVGHMERDLFHYLERIEEIVEHAKAPLAQRGTLSSMDVAPTWRAIFHGGLFLDQLLPSLDRIFEVEKKTVANVRAGLAGVAATRYRLRNGQYPADILELVDEYLQFEQTIDPFTGTPLDYSLDEGGFTVTVEGEVLLDVRGRGTSDSK